MMSSGLHSNRVTVRAQVFSKDANLENLSAASQRIPGEIKRCLNFGIKLQLEKDLSLPFWDYHLLIPEELIYMKSQMQTDIVT